MKRSLTVKEIEDLTSFITPNKMIPEETAKSIASALRERLQKQLRTVKVYPEIIPSLGEMIESSHQRSLVEAGECVGIVCAQSIGQDQTQRNLDSFHRAGLTEKAVVVGVPRCKELLSATANPKMESSRIYFKEHAHGSLQDLRKEVGHTIVGLNFDDISLEMLAVLGKEHESWYEHHAILYGDRFGTLLSDTGHDYTDCVELKLNMGKLYEYRLTLPEIAKAIMDEYGDAAVVFSPPSIGRMDIYFDTEGVELPADRAYYAGTEEASLIYLEEVVIPILEKFTIKGIRGITNIFYNKTDTEWVAETDGSNLQGLMAHPNIDEERTMSNNVWDIYRTLGIEAAIQFLIEEFGSIMEGINGCHPALLVDRMTHGGTIASISRYTLRDEESGPIGKASFEECMANFNYAAVRGENEPVRGVSASTICGKMAQIGTGKVTVLIDTSKLPDEPEGEEEDEEDEEEIVMKPVRERTTKPLSQKPILETIVRERKGKGEGKGKGKGKEKEKEKRKPKTKQVAPTFVEY